MSFISALLAAIDAFGLYSVLVLVGLVALARLAYDQIRKRRRRRRMSTETMDGGTSDMAQYKAMYDKPDEQVMAETGWPLVGVWAVKDALINFGYELDYPPPEDYNAGWHKVEV